MNGRRKKLLDVAYIAQFIERMTVDHTFGQKLRALREARNLGQKEASEALGVTYGSYRNWEYDRNTPTELLQEGVLAKFEKVEPKKQ